MTRRLTTAIVGVAVGALVLAGLGTLLLAQLAARGEARTGIEEQAVELAQRVELVQDRRLLTALVRALDLRDAALLRLGPRGTQQGQLPDGVVPADLDLGRLRSGAVVSGTHGRLVFAAAPVPLDRALGVVVLTDRVDSGARTAMGWFLLAAAVTLALAAAVASRLGRRLTAPVRAAEAATRRVASGDLSARVAVPAGSDELASLARSVNTMAAELERSRGLERQFLLSVSHDLRTPLTSIRGFAEAIADGTVDDHARAGGVIAAESRRLERLVRDLLELAKLDTRQFSLDVRSTDVAEVVAETAEGFRPAADQAGIALTVDVGGDGVLPPATADPDRLAQVVANLVENGLKFARSRIVVGAGPRPDGVALWVEDDGPGIPAADQSRVWDRLFTSSARPPSRQLGSGLGLAIVRELAEAMGGGVRLDSGSGGTRMEVILRPWSSSASPTSS